MQCIIMAVLNELLVHLQGREDCRKVTLVLCRLEQARMYRLNHDTHVHQSRTVRLNLRLIFHFPKDNSFDAIHQRGLSLNLFN